MFKSTLLTILAYSLSISLFAGCMKSEITQIDTKLKNAEISKEAKQQVIKLRKMVVDNEHGNSELAFESYEKAMSILN